MSNPNGGQNQNFASLSFLQGANAVYVERLYGEYAKDPAAVDPTWRAFFEALGDSPQAVEAEVEGAPWGRADWPPVASGEWVSASDGQWPAPAALDRSPKAIADKLKAKAPAGSPAADPAAIRSAALDSIRALMLIRAYRIVGHLAANLDPLGLVTQPPHPELEPSHYGFAEADLDRPIFIDKVLGLETASMREIVKILKRTYCGTFALQYMHITNGEEVAWLKDRIEGRDKEIAFTPEGRKAILNKLVEAEGFERFLNVKFTGTKRFGLDGGEALIPAMEQIIKRGGNLGLKDIVVGMPHRGRLNVLANVLAKPYRAIFHEFQGGSVNPDDVGGSGDVKYHLGASSDRSFDGNSVHLSLTANPSHLEAVNPVVLGKVRAKQTQLSDKERTQAAAVLLHGDAAFAGQGVVAECLGMSGLVGHRTGGAIHIIVNNQIGFTTAPRFSRSSPYPSDIALMVEPPIFHVNGDDPEAVVHAAKVAIEYRQKFHKDVVLDIFCYRRFGHNEGDEPMFTQPKMYKLIKGHPTTLELYAKRLVEEGAVTEAEVAQMKTDFQNRLQTDFDMAKDYLPNKADWLDGRWSGFGSDRGEDESAYQRGDTAAPLEQVQAIGKALTTPPEGFNIHRTLERFVAARKKMFETGEGFDWATGEALAFGSLVQQGYPVRLAGQDCIRGTFSQRHSAFIDQETEDRYFPLRNLSPEQADFEVIDSMLSEYAVLGFEYGYSLSEPKALTLWEAQFGDFTNGAQIMIDQFISSGESKWLRMSGLVMLLPHGMEGAGPEHSSGRPERFLQNSAENNWIIANCSTPANYFHILRRQLMRNFRKPLVLFTPKSLLRHKRCVSKITDFTQGSSFHRLLWDGAQVGESSTVLKPDDQIRRVVLCTGKVYYDLLETREAQGIDDVYLLRVEQMYPFPAQSVLRELKRFPNADVVWCQEEPKNQGAWFFMEPNLEWALGRVEGKAQRARYVGRKAAAAPATGLASRHAQEQAALVAEALALQA
ncbi:2-oxoglutarate dehydrogenase E1 component [Neomegalonema perideroedes]|uniref:2-oxoglutarate dehydrogenase E1 component n=1 Tax=Neomegalonema perideroedes TaxID=217219 RepID=UPI000475F0D0|nr:2-oxoglutarate dehydrogenase E1 component [Neomegalonema perideroedes]